MRHAVVVVALGLAASPLSAQTPATAELSAASQVAGFEQRCASCHDNPGSNPAPSRAAMMKLSAERVLEALTAGSMAKHAEGLTDAQKRAMAELTAGKPFVGAAPRDAASMKNRCTTPLSLTMSAPQWNGWSPEPTTGSLILDAAGGRLFVPVSSWEEIPGSALTYNCCTFQGSVVALELRTGKQLWKTHTMLERPQPLRKNSAGVQLYGPAGAAVWNTPTLDMKRGILYAGTSNGYIGGQGGNEITDSIVAFDIQTGRRLWWRQMVPNDINCGGGGRTDAERRLNCPGYVRNPNDDVSSSAILHTLPSGRTLLLVPQESGRLTAIDPDRKGEVVWVAQVGDTMANSSIFGGAYDGQFFYRGVGFQDGTGAMAAMRADTGERVWYTTVAKSPACGEANPSVCSGRQTGGTTGMPGVVFTGARDGVLRAYSTSDGKIIWESPTNRLFETVNGVPAHGGGFSGPGGPTIVGGMLFTGSGYSILNGAPGNVLLAFGLD